MRHIIFHIDVNSAYLSWTAIEYLKRGEEDLRGIPCIIGGEIQTWSCTCQIDTCESIRGPHRRTGRIGVQKMSDASVGTAGPQDVRQVQQKTDGTVKELYPGYRAAQY